MSRERAARRAAASVAGLLEPMRVPLTTTVNPKRGEVQPVEPFVAVPHRWARKTWAIRPIPSSIRAGFAFEKLSRNVLCPVPSVKKG